ncbi:glycoside hydrolase family 43 protein [Herbiconiux sp. P17]|uniref:glycoside hydrolase family 43 protein n=1 Tax=Herbiconiux wuyangfengii TaxID=3342794 RepID=UPI0035B7CEDA
MTDLERSPHALPVVTPRVFRNPLSFGPDGTPTSPDPFVLRHLGRYYCFSTHRDGVALSVSDDLVSWRRLGLALEVAGRSEYWAPCLAAIDGRFYLYFSNRPAGSDDPHEEVLQVAVADRIEGPYTVVHRFFDTFSIDPHVVRDPSGAWFLFYSTNEPTGFEQDTAGTSILVDRMLSPTELAGEPRAIVLPSIDEEVFEHNRFGDRDWFTIEGASYFTHHDRAFMTYSGNAYERPDYFIGYSSAALDATGSIGSLAWQKHPNDLEWEPLVRRSRDVEGTGHNSIVEAPNLVDRWIIYHGRDAAEPIRPGVEQRVMRMDPLVISGGRLTTVAPSSTSQDAPAAPTVAARFDNTSDLSPWRVVSGSLRIDGTLRISDSADTLLVHPHRSSAYVAEVSVRLTRGHLGARGGVIPWFAADDDYVEALLDAATRSVLVNRHVNGFVTSLGRWPMPDAPDGAWRVIRVERTLTRVTLTVDGVTAGAFDVPADGASFGLRTIRTSAEVAGFALTDHLALYGSRLSMLPAIMTASPSIALVGGQGPASRSRRPLVLTGPPPAPGDVVDLEVELSAGYASVVVTLSDDDGCGVTVQVVPGSATISTVGGAAGSADRPGSPAVAGTDASGTALAHAATVPLGDDRLTLRTHPVAGGVVVGIDGHAQFVALDSAPTRSRLELIGSRLVSFERTSTQPSKKL